MGVYGSMVANDFVQVPYTYCWSPSLIPKPIDWGDHIGECWSIFAVCCHVVPDVTGASCFCGCLRFVENMVVAHALFGTLLVHHLFTLWKSNLILLRLD